MTHIFFHDMYTFMLGMKYMAALVTSRIFLHPQKIGHGEHVLLIPGHGRGDWVLRPLANWLDRMGFHPHLSHISTNINCPSTLVPHIENRVEEIHKENGNAPIYIIGHSLGGIYARWYTMNHPEHVLYAIAIGSPIRLPVEDLTVYAQLTEVMGERLLPECIPTNQLDCACGFVSMFSRVVKEKFASIFSKEDEIIPWQASMDIFSPNIEVSGAHLELIFSSSVFEQLQELLGKIVPVPPERALIISNAHYTA